MRKTFFSGTLYLSMHLDVFKALILHTLHSYIKECKELMENSMCHCLADAIKVATVQQKSHSSSVRTQR